MNLQTEKIELVKLILDTEDTNLIGEIKKLFKSKEIDFWTTLPDHVKAGVRKSQEQLRNGEGISYEDAMKSIDKI